MPEINLVSEIAGTVWSVETAVGETVAAAAVIVVIESMKMEIPVVAPVAGIVREICVAKDDTVDEGHVLAVIERV